MNGMSLEALLAEARDPETPGWRLAELAQWHPDTRPALALNPSTYPELLSWLAETRDPEVTVALQARASSPSTAPRPSASTAPAARRRKVWWISAATVASILIAAGLAVPTIATSIQADTCNADTFYAMYGDDRILESTTSSEEMLESIALPDELTKWARNDVRTTLKQLERNDTLCVGYFNMSSADTDSRTGLVFALVTNPQKLALALDAHAESINYEPAALNDSTSHSEYGTPLNENWLLYFRVFSAKDWMDPDLEMPSDFKSHSPHEVGILEFRIKSSESP